MRKIHKNDCFFELYYYFLKHFWMKVDSIQEFVKECELKRKER